MPNLDPLRISSHQLDELTGLDISDTAMGWAYRQSVFCSPRKLLSWASTQVFLFGVALVFCVPTTLIFARSLSDNSVAAVWRSLPIGVGIAIALTLALSLYFGYQGRQLATLSHLLDQVDRFNEMLTAIEILEELQTASPSNLSLDNREAVLEAMHVNRESLVCALTTERIMRKHQRFIAQRYELFTSIENNLATLQTLKGMNEASEYGRLLNEALQIGTSIHQELRPFYSDHSK